MAARRERTQAVRLAWLVGSLLAAVLRWCPSPSFANSSRQPSPRTPGLSSSGRRTLRVARWQQQVETGLVADIDEIALHGLEEANIDLDILDDRQKEAVDAALAGKNLFITGGAGTGKTLTVKAIKQELERKFGAGFEEKVAITGTTGTSAILAGGCTLHTATNLRVPMLASDFKRVGHSPFKEIWSRKIEVLLVDESSMLSGEFLDRFDQQIRIIKADDRPFGGIQVILVGDIFQLPPIGNQLPEEVARDLIAEDLQIGVATTPTPKGRSKREWFTNRGMIFQSDAFWALDFKTVELRIPHRQMGDQNLAKILAKLRLGPDEQAIATLNRHCYDALDPPAEKSKDSVFLYPTVKQVNRVNTMRLNELEGKSEFFEAVDGVEVSDEFPENSTEEERLKLQESRRYMLEHSGFFEDDDSASPANKKIELKVDALVMLTSSINQRLGLVNGLTGHILRFKPRGILVHFLGHKWPMLIEKHTFTSRVPGIGTCMRTQYPLRLAWAITHHRSQGKTLGDVVVDPRCFTEGQAYVALSRSPSLDSLKLVVPAKAADFRVHPASLRFKELKEEGAPSETIQREVGHWRDLPVPGGPAGPNEIMPFGKFRGRTYEYVATNHTWYINWVLAQEGPSKQLLRFQDFVVARLRAAESAAETQAEELQEVEVSS